MHPFAKRSFEFFKSSYVIKKKNPKILDLGSMDINGTIKNQIDFESSYIGADLEPGKNVDVVLENPYKLPFEDNSFDFVIAFASIYMLNFSGVLSALREIQRVCKGTSYVTLGAYQTKEKKELFLEWTLLGTTILHKDEWLEVFQETGYTGDYFFTSAKSLHLVRG